MAKNIIAGQKIGKEKLQKARELRARMTPEEKILWNKLRAKRLLGLHFRRQQVIDGFIADFYCHEPGLVVEVDGEIHTGQREYDAEREKVLSRRKLHVLRFKNREIRENLGEVLSKISEACRKDLTPQPPLRRREGE